MNYISLNRSFFPMGRLVNLSLAVYLAASSLLLFCFAGIQQQNHNDAIQQSIAHEVIRLHVLANSDSEEDQQLKLQVRDAVTDYMQKELTGITSIDKARSVLLADSAAINAIAKNAIKDAGYSYSVTTILGTSYFPEKSYGDLTFPEGSYEALQVKIGDAAGQNWWCVLFPSLCFVDTASAVVPEESKSLLKDALTIEEYNSLLTDTDTEITWRFALWDMITGSEE